MLPEPCHKPEVDCSLFGPAQPTCLILQMNFPMQLDPVVEMSS